MYVGNRPALHYIGYAYVAERKATKFIFKESTF